MLISIERSEVFTDRLYDQFGLIFSKATDKPFYRITILFAAIAALTGWNHILGYCTGAIFGIQWDVMIQCQIIAIAAIYAMLLPITITLTGLFYRKIVWQCEFSSHSTIAIYPHFMLVIVPPLIVFSVDAWLIIQIALPFLLQQYVSIFLMITALVSQNAFFIFFSILLLSCQCGLSIGVVVLIVFSFNVFLISLIVFSLLSMPFLLSSCPIFPFLLIKFFFMCFSIIFALFSKNLFVVFVVLSCIRNSIFAMLLSINALFLKNFVFMNPISSFCHCTLAITAIIKKSIWATLSIIKVFGSCRKLVFTLSTLFHKPSYSLPSILQIIDENSHPVKLWGMVA